MIKLVIDTKNYSGNFEREMFKYCTGLEPSEYNREQNFSPKLTQEVINNIEKYVEGIYEEYGYTYVTIYETPNRFNNGMGESFDDLEENLIPAKIARNLTLQNEFNTKHKVENTNFDYFKNILENHLKTSLVKYPSYESVAFYFRDNTPREIFKLISELAQDFCKEKNLTYISTRLILEKIITTEESL